MTTRPSMSPGQAGALEEHQDPGKSIRGERWTTAPGRLGGFG